MTGRTGPVGVGLIGTGMISDYYLDNLVRFPDLVVHALGDLDDSRAAEKAAKYGIPVSGSTRAVLDHPDVEIVINLTIPAAHVPVSLEAIAAGKHVWIEKPIGIDRASAADLLKRAADAGLRVGVAPDTVLNPGIQTARRALLDGVIGRPLTARTMMRWTGPDLVHPAPEFLFARGGGPLLDMGPYYLTSLVSIFGPVSRVMAAGSIARPTRSVRVGERAGTVFPVEVPTHVDALLLFANGAHAQCTFSNDSPVFEHGTLEVYGETGMLLAPDPNMPDGDTRIARHPLEYALPLEPTWETIAPAGVVIGRGLGPLEMARAIREDRPHTATGELALHILDVMLAIEESVASREPVALTTTVAEVPLIDSSRDPFARTV